MAYYIHWESKFATGDNKAQHDRGLHTLASKVATSAYKRADKRIYKTESTSEGTRPGKVGPRKQPNKLMRPQLCQ